MNWGLILTLAAFFTAAGLSFMLGACMAAARADEQREELLRQLEEAERAVRHGDACPWPIIGNDR
jgi:hypothetical protein